jgi:hypothetical protein
MGLVVGISCGSVGTLNQAKTRSICRRDADPASAPGIRLIMMNKMHRTPHSSRLAEQAACAPICFFAFELG